MIPWFDGHLIPYGFYKNMGRQNQAIIWGNILRTSSLLISAYFFKVFSYINMKLIYKKWVYLRFMVLAPLEIDKLNSRLKKSLNWCLLVTFWRIIIVGIRRNGIFSNVKHWSLHQIVLYWNVSNGNVKYGKKVHCGHEGIKLPVLVER